jgi:phage gpG-like protein
MKPFTIEGFAHFLIHEVNIAHAERAGIEAAAQIVQTEAKRVIGTYDYGWPPLKEATIARKANGDTPLLETGEMRDSIEYTVINDHEAEVGSNSDKAVWHELGTSKIPARSFLAGAAIEKAHEASRVIGISVAAAIASRNIDVEILKLAGHAIKEVAHSVREMVPDDPDEKGRHR